MAFHRITYLTAFSCVMCMRKMSQNIISKHRSLNSRHWITTGHHHPEVISNSLRWPLNQFSLPKNSSCPAFPNSSDLYDYLFSGKQSLILLLVPVPTHRTSQQSFILLFFKSFPFFPCILLQNCIIYFHG